MTDPGGPATSSEIVFYQGEDGRSRIQVRLDGGTVWLTQRLLAELFQKDVRTINEHLQNIFEEGEADPGATIRKFRIVQIEGTREVARLVDHYNLDVILAVGYRVRSSRGTQFRRWATERLTEYMVKGFVLDDERLKEGRSLGTDYFDELLERIREIRASEKRFYQKIRDLYALAIDYDASAAETREFFQVVQNKLHWAITGSTAAEIIAERRKPLYMRDWREKLDGFLKFNEREVLKDAGRVSAEIAQALALGEYEKFDRKRIADEALAPDELDAAAKRIGSKTPGKGGLT